MKYISITGKTTEVIETGKSFKTVTVYPATPRMEAETVTRTHRTWGGVEKQIKGMEKV